MKHYRRGLTLALIAATVLTLGSCTWFLSIFNHMEIDGETHELDELVVLYGGSEGGVHYHWLYFLSDGMDFSLSTGFTGTGEILALGLVGPSSSLSDGEYDYDGTTFSTYTVALGVAITGATFSGGSLASYDLQVGIDGGQVFLRETLEDGYAFLFDLDGFDFDLPSRRLSVDGRYRGAIDQEYDATVFAARTSADTRFNLFPGD